MNNYLENSRDFPLTQQSGSIGDMDKEPSVSYLLTTGKIIQDSASGKFSFIDVFDIIVIPKNDPSTIQSFSIGGKLMNAKAGILSVDVKILNPKGEVLSKMPLSGKVNGGDVELSVLFPIVEFKDEGVYLLKVSMDGKDLPDDNKFYFKVRKEK